MLNLNTRALNLRIDQYITVILIVSVLLLPHFGVPQSLAQTVSYQLVEVAPVPVLQSSDLDSVNFVATLSARAVVVIDNPSASILLAKNSNMYVSPASTTKLMTALVARDVYLLDQVIPVREEAFTVGHVAGLPIGSEFRVEELLKALLIESGNDAAFVLAQHHTKGYQGFISQMNQKAEALHLEHTSFTNPSGLDAAAHYTTAFDLSLIAREVMKDPVLQQIVNKEQAVITDATGRIQIPLYTTNQLLSRPDVVGIKTGTTDLAGEALITQVERDGRQVIIVVLGSRDRYTDTVNIINWIFQQYSWENFSVS